MRGEATVCREGEVVQQEVMVLARKSESGTSGAVAQQQRLKCQQHKIGCGFSG